MININKDSWHYKAVKNFVYVESEMPTNFCGYFWALFMQVIFFPVVLIFAFAWAVATLVTTAYYNWYVLFLFLMDIPIGLSANNIIALVIMNIALFCFLIIYLQTKGVFNKLQDKLCPKITYRTYRDQFEDIVYIGKRYWYNKNEQGKRCLSRTKDKEYHQFCESDVEGIKNEPIL